MNTVLFQSFYYQYFMLANGHPNAFFMRFQCIHLKLILYGCYKIFSSTLPAAPPPVSADALPFPPPLPPRLRVKVRVPLEG